MISNSFLLGIKKQETSASITEKRDRTFINSTYKTAILPSKVKAIAVLNFYLDLFHLFFARLIVSDGSSPNIFL